MVIISPTGPTIPTPDRGIIYLPIVSGGDTLSVNLAYQFYLLMMSDPRQQRKTLTVCPGLVRAAKLRAYGL